MQLNSNVKCKPTKTTKLPDYKYYNKWTATTLQLKSKFVSNTDLIGHKNWLNSVNIANKWSFCATKLAKSVMILC